MESISTENYFKFNPNSLEEVRKSYSLDQPGAMANAIDILQEWLKKQDHFVKKDFDRDYLERTIIRAKGSVERSKQRLDKLCSAKTLMPSMFELEGTVKGLTHLECVQDMFLPRPTSDNYRVYMLRNFGNEFGSKFYTHFYKRLIQYVEYQYANDYTHGVVIVFDYRDTNLLAMVKGFDLVELQNVINVSLDCYGVRLKGMHLISSSKVVELLVSIFKQMLSAKLGNRIHVHKNVDTLYEHLEKDILPVEYGGTEKSFEELFNQFQDELTSERHLEHMKIMTTAGTNEAYRQTDKFNEQCLGMPGTFRSLTVD